MSRGHQKRDHEDIKEFRSRDLNFKLNAKSKLFIKFTEYDFTIKRALCVLF